MPAHSKHLSKLQTAQFIQSWVQQDPTIELAAALGPTVNNLEEMEGEVKKGSNPLTTEHSMALATAADALHDRLHLLEQHQGLGDEHNSAVRHNALKVLQGEQKAKMDSQSVRSDLSVLSKWLRDPKMTTYAKARQAWQKNKSLSDRAVTSLQLTRLLSTAPIISLYQQSRNDWSMFQSAMSAQKLVKPWTWTDEETLAVVEFVLDIQAFFRYPQPSGSIRSARRACLSNLKEPVQALLRGKILSEKIASNLTALLDRFRKHPLHGRLAGMVRDTIPDELLKLVNTAEGEPLGRQTEEVVFIHEDPASYLAENSLGNSTRFSSNDLDCRASNSQLHTETEYDLDGAQTAFDNPSSEAVALDSQALSYYTGEDGSVFVVQPLNDWQPGQQTM